MAYYGLPSLKIKEPIESPIDIVEDTPISSKTSLKLGETKVKEVKEIKKTQSISQPKKAGSKSQTLEQKVQKPKKNKKGKAFF